MSGLDRVFIGFAVARTAYAGSGQVDRLRARLALMEAEQARLRAENWRLRDANQHAEERVREAGRRQGWQEAAEAFGVTTRALQEQVTRYGVQLVGLSGPTSRPGGAR